MFKQPLRLQPLPTKDVNFHVNNAHGVCTLDYKVLLTEAMMSVSTHGKFKGYFATHTGGVNRQGTYKKPPSPKLQEEATRNISTTSKMRC